MYRERKSFPVSEGDSFNTSAFCSYAIPVMLFTPVLTKNISLKKF